MRESRLAAVLAAGQRHLATTGDNEANQAATELGTALENEFDARDNKIEDLEERLAEFESAKERLEERLAEVETAIEREEQGDKTNEEWEAKMAVLAEREERFFRLMEPLSDRLKRKWLERARADGLVTSAHHPLDEETYVVGTVEETMGPHGYPMYVVRVESGPDEGTWAFLNHWRVHGMRGLGSDSHYAVCLADDPEGQREVPFLGWGKHEMSGHDEYGRDEGVNFATGSRVKFIPVERERIHRDESGAIPLVKVERAMKKVGDGKFEIPDDARGIAAMVVKESEAPPPSHNLG